MTHVFHRSVRQPPEVAVSGVGVACIGHGNERVAQAIDVTLKAG